MEKVIFGSYEYTIVDKVPNGYIVWNIGMCMGSDEYIPFCQIIPGTFSIIPETLLAVKLPKEEVEILREVAGRGDTDIKTMNSRITRHRKYDSSKETLIKAKDILEKIYA